MPWGSWINELPTSFFLTVHSRRGALLRLQGNHQRPGARSPR
jgi:hypothetical protein